MKLLSNCSEIGSTRRLGRRLAVTLTAIGVALTMTAGAAYAAPVRSGSGVTDPASTSKVTLRLTDLSQLPRVGATESRSGILASYFFQYVRNGHYGQCLDGDRNTIPANGSRVQLWACNRWTNQAWILTTASGYPVGYYRIQNYYGRQCLDGDRNTIPANGSRVQLWACNGWTNQVWVWNGAQFRNYYGRQCLDGDRNTIPANGSRVQLWACNGWTNQNWTLSN
ncbi:RICIN domain-containing protein [Plantactinospora solaniradicis]|uniref:RICIN domain-containing protein n=1 Tax=Plantactinospora solaniradicis TaxID=1723736 RepID=A0ABW1K4N2_9ACTN